METARDFIPFEDHGQGTDPAPASGVDGALAVLRDVSATAVEDAACWGLKAASDFAGLVEELSRTAEYLQVVAASAVDRARKQSAADAGKAGTSWTTGWREDAAEAATGVGPSSGTLDGAPGSAAASGIQTSAAAAAAGSGAADDAGAGAVDDGYRNTAEFLRARLLISAAEARRRLSLAERLLPRRGLAGQPVPAVHEELGAAVAAGEVASRAATVITLALEKVRHACDAEALARMEHALTRTAAGERRRLPGPGRPQLDRRDRPGRRRTLRGAAAPAPGRLHPPPAPRPAPRRDLRDHRTIRTPPHRHEHRHQPPHRHHERQPQPPTPRHPPPLSVQPPLPPPVKTWPPPQRPVGAARPSQPPAGVQPPETNRPPARPSAGVPRRAALRETGVEPATGWGSAAGEIRPSAGVRPPRRDSAGGASRGAVVEPAFGWGSVGGVSACDSRPAVATVADVPAAPVTHAVRGSPRFRGSRRFGGSCRPGGRSRRRGPGPAVPAAKAARRPGRCLQTRPRHRPAARRGRAPPPGHGHHRLPGPAHPARHAPRRHGRRGRRPGPAPRALQRTERRLEQTGSLLFTGPVTAGTVRKIACDADIIPVLLGGEGRILDIGRASRLFPPHLRKALIARDQGCAFPGCTIPAPWCEAHHITYWSRGGTSGTDNGALLCSHHHHVIHKEALEHPGPHRGPLVHPAAPPRPAPAAPPQPLLQTRRPHHGRMTAATGMHSDCRMADRPSGSPGARHPGRQAVPAVPGIKGRTVRLEDASGASYLDDGDIIEL